jgi:hypothetical protein
MGLKSVVQNAVKAGFSAMGSSANDGLNTSAVYTKVETGAYDTTTGTIAKTLTAYDIDVIFYKVRDREIDGIKVKINDIRIIFPQSLLTFSPTANDYITINGNKMDIVQIQQDPASAVHILFVRGT